jgi:TolB-like protein/lipopolysaccharide biosynthesis regulator YciM
MNEFLQRLKQRKLVQWTLAYVAAAFALLQGTDIVAQRFGWPEQTMRFVIIALSVGFFVTLVLAWYHGERGAQRMTGTELVILALLLAIGGGFLWNFAGRPSKAAASATPFVADTAPIPEKSIAVLPFENLSDDKNAGYFADGVQDEILTKLASIADLKVISRTSTAKYKSKPEDLKTVAQQLGVATVLEGTVQKAADKVHVNVQLIDARADSHLWAKSYDRDLKDVFAVEAEVAQEIADSLKARLSPAEANTVASVPTQDTAAYDLFLKGEFEYRLASASLRPERYDQAAAWYEQAIAIDPKFAIAIAHLVICRLNRHWFVENLTDAQLTEIKDMAEHAVSLAPGAADTHVALGLYHYFGYRQYQQALAAFARALELQPNNASALEYSGYVHRRLGDWKVCVAQLTKALERDPRNADAAGNLGQTYALMRQWTEAERICRNTLAIDPHDVIAMRALLGTFINSRGDIAKALQLLNSFPPDEKIVTTSISGTIASVTGERAYTFVLARDFDAALKVWDGPPTNEIDERARLAARATIRVVAGDLAGAKADGQKAERVLEMRVRERPNELIALRQLSWTYLALGRNADAVGIARQMSNLLPPEKDALLGVSVLSGLAEIEARTGAGADAVSILRRLLTVPGGESVSIARLKIDPVWDPIRNDPGFQQLLTMTEHVGP